MHSGGRGTYAVGLALWALLALGFADTEIAIAQPTWSQSARVPGVSQLLNDAAPRALGVPADCNSNGIDDELDIAAGTSADCNSNGLPDECDLVPGGFPAQIAKLTAADAAEFDEFGGSVALSGDTAVIGAVNDDGAGSAYVFVRSGGVWTEQAKLTAADAAAGDNFGYSVALSGDTAVVGTYRDDDGGLDSGSAYVFVRSGGIWTQQAKLTAADAGEFDNLGYSVALSGGTAVVGAYGDDDGGSLSGSAYVFVRSGGVWTQQAKLTAADAGAGDDFGFSVTLSGDTAVVGAHQDDDGGTTSGSAYVFVRSGGVWTQQAKLTATDAAAGDFFGSRVALSGDTAVVGAYLDDDGGTDSGSAYVFVRSGGVWTQQAKLTAADAAAGDSFGRSVALSGDTAVVGAQFDDDGGSDSGSAYVFELGLIPDSLDLNSNGIPDECEVDCNLNGVPDDLDIAAGTSQDCNDNALPDDCELAGNDCNTNATPDECDFAAGTSEDCNVNALPDECDVVPSGVAAQLAKLTAADAAADDRFGASVALSGDTAVVAAFFDDDGGANSGSAYVFVRNGGVWTQQAKLTAADAAAGDQFGWSVALSGDTAVVGANSDDDGGFESGSAYVFVRSGGVWTQQAKLTAADAAAGDQFGYSVALSGHTAVIGAYADDDGGFDSGSAYVFVRTGGVWTQQAKLTAADAATFDFFGHSVALSGDTAVIGNPYDDDGGTDSGSAYVFVRSGGVWTQQAKLTAADAADDDLFGSSVALSGDTAVVGARLDDDGGANSGSAYVFVRSGGVWTQQAKLTAADAAALDYFGYSVALSGDTAVVGAYGDDDGGQGSGSAYVFVRSGEVWTQQAKLTAADAAASDYFGISVALSGDTAVVGTVNPGSAYVFDLGLLPDSLDLNSNGIPDECEIDCNLNGVPDDLDIAAGTADDCNDNGALDSCDVDTQASPDVNGDDIPDECQVVNLTQGTAHPTIPSAIAAAAHFDKLLAAAGRFGVDTIVDFSGKHIALASRGTVVQPAGGILTLADDAVLSADDGDDAYFDGAISAGFADRAEIAAQNILIDSNGVLQIAVFAGIEFVSATTTNRGDILIYGGALAATGGLFNDADGLLSGYGDFQADTANAGDVVIIADSQLVGDYANDGTTTVQNGTLTITGGLTDNGTIIGDVSAARETGLPRSAGDGLTVLGGYSMGPGASLHMASPQLAVAVGGDFDAAIDDNTRYDMAQATLRMIGLGALDQQLEVMSTDIGPYLAGLNRMLPGHYPIGTLRIGPTPTRVNIVDQHDNDGLGQAACEAIYVRELVIDSGATLNTGTCRVYYLTLTNNGAVDVPGNLVAIVEVPGDFDGDGDIDLDDHLYFTDCLNGPDLPPDPVLPNVLPQDCLNAFDFDGGGDVDLIDFAIMQEEFTGPGG